MKIYWTAPSPPELASFSAAERKRIWSECSIEGLRNRRTWIGMLACGACTGVGSLIGDFFHIGIWGAGIGGGIGGFLLSQFAIRSALEVVRKKYRLPEPDNNAPNQ